MRELSTCHTLGTCCCCSSVAKSCPTLWPCGLLCTTLLCPSPSPGVCSDSLSRWCYPTILSSVIPSPPALNLSQHQDLSQWVDSSHQHQSIGASASASVLPVNVQDCISWWLLLLLAQTLCAAYNVPLILLE